MGFLGMVTGASLGRIFGPIGMLAGAILGYVVEDRVVDGVAARGRSRRAPERGRRSGVGQDPRDEVVFLSAIGAMLAKMAKADGRVSRSEVDSVERAFARLGIRGEKRAFCVEAFRRAKDDPFTIFDYAANFARLQASLSMRELLYSILWDLAAADGTLSAEEDAILKAIPRPLGISVASYHWYRRQYDAAAGRGSGAGASSRAEPHAAGSAITLAEAYRMLGVGSSASPEEVKRAYRAKAKQLHPDLLTARGLPPEMVKRAEAELVRVNDAYARIRATWK